MIKFQLLKILNSWKTKQINIMRTDDIPHVNNCPRTCSDCCGPVPFTESEFKDLPRKHRRTLSMRKFADGSDKCCFSTPSGCAIYDRRPLMCRLFGASEQPRMRCPHGVKADNPLTSQETARMVRDAILDNKGETFIS